MAEIRSNDDSSRLGLYAGIIGAGFATGAALAVRNDPIYDGTKEVYRKARLKQAEKVARNNAQWNAGYMPFVMGDEGYDAYDTALRKGDYSLALRMERSAQQKFLRMSDEERQTVIQNFNKLNKESGSFISRMFRRIPKRL